MAFSFPVKVLNDLGVLRNFRHIERYLNTLRPSTSLKDGKAECVLRFDDTNKRLIATAYGVEKVVAQW